MQPSTEALKGDFRNFLYVLWQWLPDIRRPPSAVQYDIASYLQHGPRRRMVKGFRGVGKSWITAAFVLWCLLRNPEERILVTSASKDRADAFSIFTRRLIEEFPPLRHLRPRRGQRDSTLAFDVGPSSPAQSPSVKSAGIFGQITGSRATKIVADDIETTSNSLTQLMRDRLSEAIKEFDAILVPDGDIIYLGTDQTEMSVYKRLPERGYNVRIWPARIPAKEKVPHYGDELAPFVHGLIAKGAKPWTPVDPERFTDADLIEREASYGRGGFALQFMLDPSLSDAERYPLRCSDLMVHDLDEREAPMRLMYGSDRDQTIEGLECPGLAGDRFLRPRHVSDDYVPFARAVMFVDPSGRGKDRTGVVVLRYALGRVFLVGTGSFPGGYEEETLKAIAKLAYRHKVHEVFVEPNFGDGMFRTLLTPVLNRIHPCSVEDSEWVRTQKEVRIIDTLEPVLMRHRLVVDRQVVDADAKREPHHQLFYQLTRVTRERGALAHDDLLDALAGGVRIMIEDLDVDEGVAEQRAREAALDEELNRFLDEAVGGPAPGRGLWNTLRRH